MSSNHITPLPLKPSHRGRKSGQMKKTPQRGMGVAQLELLRHQELWAPHFYSHHFPDRRLPPLPPVPILPGPLRHVTGAVSESYCCNVGFNKKKRLHNYGIEEAPPVAGGYGHVGPTDNNHNLNNIGAQEILGCVENEGNVLTRYEFFPEKMIGRDRNRDRDRQVMITNNKLGGSSGHDALPLISGNAALDHRSKTTIDLSLRL